MTISISSIRLLCIYFQCCSWLLYFILFLSVFFLYMNFSRWRRRDGDIKCMYYSMKAWHEQLFFHWAGKRQTRILIVLYRWKWKYKFKMTFTIERVNQIVPKNIWYFGHQFLSVFFGFVAWKQLYMYIFIYTQLIDHRLVWQFKYDNPHFHILWITLFVWSPIRANPNALYIPPGFCQCQLSFWLCSREHFKRLALIQIFSSLFSHSFFSSCF